MRSTFASKVFVIIQKDKLNEKYFYLSLVDEEWYLHKKCINSISKLLSLDILRQSFFVTVDKAENIGPPF
jgi:hypothetical protein